MESERVISVCTRCLYTFFGRKERCPLCNSKIDQAAAKKLADDMLALTDEEKMRGI